MKLKRPLLLATLSLGCFSLGSLTAAPAHAERDIAYSARYYLKPGSRGTSRSYIYTINPDGSGRKQLTSGPNNDQYPQWSPNGKQILFIRNPDTTTPQLCIVGANGGPVRKVMTLDDGWEWLRWTPNGKSLSGVHSDWKAPQGASAFRVFDFAGKTLYRRMSVQSYDWSPGGAYLALHSADIDGVTKIVDWKTSREVTVQGPAYGIAWLNASILMGLEYNRDKETAFVREYDTAGKLRRRSSITVGGKGIDGTPDERSRLKAIPGSKDNALFVCNESTSSGQQFAYCPFTLGRPSATPLVEGTSLSFSPDAARYAVIQYHDLTPYDKKNGGRQVYTAPLQIGATSGGAPKNIVSGLVYVTGCDWRKPVR